MRTKFKREGEYMWTLIDLYIKVISDNSWRNNKVWIFKTDLVRL
jgi:hypothetical protein